MTGPLRLQFLEPDEEKAGRVYLYILLRTRIDYVNKNWNEVLKDLHNELGINV